MSFLYSKDDCNIIVKNCSIWTTLSMTYPSVMNPSWRKVLRIKMKSLYKDVLKCVAGVFVLCVGIICHS